ncbi:MAG: Asp-tRNA(Asn)/Glu-tRNA(Gln) amidotransferase subunit GatC [Candidatus Saccharimonadales bacterium]
MSTITKDDVNYVAGLAKIAITDTEAEQLTKELDTILGYVKQLDSVDTTGLEPTYQVTGLVNVTRKDEIVDYGVDQAGLLQNAPDEKDGSIKVPRVL